MTFLRILVGSNEYAHECLMSFLFPTGQSYCMKRTKRVMDKNKMARNGLSLISLGPKSIIPEI